MPASRTAATKKIMLVDSSSLSQQFLREMLSDQGEVLEFEEIGKALSALKRGVSVDIAVLHYRMSLTPLIQALRHQHPEAKILAYGAPRTDTPLGVDRYLNQPVLSADLRAEVEKLAAQKRTN